MKHTKFQVFEDKAGQYRWYLRANNGEIIADSAEGYVNKRSALHGIDLIKEMNPETVNFEDLTETAEPAQAATAEATAVAGMTAEAAPMEEVTVEVPTAEAPVAAEVAMEPAKDKRMMYTGIILAVGAIVIIGLVVAAFAMGLF